MALSSIKEAINDVGNGKMVVLADDALGTTGYLIMAAETVTNEAIDFMIKHGTGPARLVLTDEYCDQLGLYPRITEIRSSNDLVLIKERCCSSVGVLSADYVQKILALLSGCTAIDEFFRLGGVHPLLAKKSGVLAHQGPFEASIDLVRLSGLKSAAVICKLKGEGGNLALATQFNEFVCRYHIRVCSIASLVTYRLQYEQLARQVADAYLPTWMGKFRVIAFENDIDGLEHVALVKGENNSSEAVLVRIHSECLTSDVFGSIRCDSGGQLSRAIDLIEKEGKGVILYMRQEGRGIGLVNELKAYELQDQGCDTVEANEVLGFKADPRDYAVSAQLLKALGVKKVRLITNNPHKILGLIQYGIRVVERIPIVMPTISTNHNYIQTKQEKLGHLLAARQINNRVCHARL